MADLKKSLELRKAKNKKNPNFDRVNSLVKIRLQNTWRRPRGRQNKTRRKFKSYLHMVTVGYGKPRITKGMHKSGLHQKIVNTVSELQTLDKNTTGVIVASNVGQKKKITILNKAKELGLRVLNLKADNYLEEVKKKVEAQKTSKKAKQKKLEKKKETTKKAEKKSDRKENKESKKTENKDNKKEETKENSPASEEKKDKTEKDKILTKREL